MGKLIDKFGRFYEYLKEQDVEIIEDQGGEVFFNVRYKTGNYYNVRLDIENNEFKCFTNLPRDSPLIEIITKGVKEILNKD